MWTGRPGSAPLGAALRTCSAIRTSRSGSPWSASTSTSRRATSRLNEALYHGGFACGGEVRDRVRRFGEARGHERPCSPTSTASCVPHGFGSRGIEGKIRAIQYVRENEIPFLGHLPGHADGLHRVRPQRRRSRGRQLLRDGRGLAAPGDRSAARAEGRRGHGRHHAPRRLPLRPAARLEGRGGLRHDSRSASATAIAGSSTPTTRTASRRPGMLFSGSSPDGRLAEVIEIPEPSLLRGVAVPPRVQEQALRLRTRSSKPSCGPRASARRPSRPPRSRNGARDGGGRQHRRLDRAKTCALVGR